MAKNKKVCEKVEQIYTWLDSQIKTSPDLAGKCSACGKCCDFDAFGHRLFVTTPELIFLTAKIGHENIKPMLKTRCPFQSDDKCTIYEYRFASCRIFCCKAEPDFRSKLTESAIKQLKSICTELDIPYNYTPLPAALNSITIIDEI